MTTTRDTESNEDRLERLGREITQHHHECVQALRTSLEHAREVGYRLIEVKKILDKKGHYHKWLGDHTELSVDQAQRYTRVANHWGKLKTLTDDVNGLTLTKALKLLSEGEKAEGGKEDKAEAPVEPLALPDGSDLDSLAEEARSLDLGKHEKVTQFVEAKVNSIVRQILRLAKGTTGRGGDESKAAESAKLALAVLIKLKKSLKQSLLVKSPGKVEPGEDDPPRERRPASRRSMNGHGRLAKV